MMEAWLKIAPVQFMNRPGHQVTRGQKRMGDDSENAPELHRLMRSVAAQLMNGPEVVIAGGSGSGPEQKLRVTRVGGGRLRSVRARINGREIQVIEQNREKPSVGANLRARDIRWCSFRMW